ncbi:MAG: zinc ABC transporter substrate-binding protein [Planctomycetes bacterium]|nr:zinc ABC transporter substrate-binding protein [Planctomycetota bacterium]
MKRLIPALLLALALPAAADDKLDVVATLPSLGGVAREVGGNRVDIAVLCKPAQDPHFVDPKPSFMVTMRNADLFIVNGLELEVGWVPPLLEGCHNARIQVGSDGYFDASGFIRIIGKPTGPVDRSQGDVHPLGNPHYTLDPLALRAVAGALAERLTTLDPEGRETYAANAKSFQKRIDEALFGADLVDDVGGAKLARLAESGELDKFLQDGGLQAKLGGWMKDLAAAKGRKVVAFHTNMNYFWNRFGLVLGGTVEAKPGIPPTAAHVADVVIRMRDEKIGLVVSQHYYDDSAVKLIAGKTGARIVMVETEGDDALAMIGEIVRKIVEGTR